MKKQSFKRAIIILIKVAGILKNFILDSKYRKIFWRVWHFCREALFFEVWTIIDTVKRRHFDLILILIHLRLFLKFLNLCSFQKQESINNPIILYFIISREHRNNALGFGAWWEDCMCVCLPHSACLCFNLRTRKMLKTSNNRISALATEPSDQQKQFFLKQFQGALSTRKKKRDRLRNEVPSLSTV